MVQMEYRRDIGNGSVLIRIKALKLPSMYVIAIAIWLRCPDELAKTEGAHSLPCAFACHTWQPPVEIQRTTEQPGCLLSTVSKSMRRYSCTYENG